MIKAKLKGKKKILNKIKTRINRVRDNVDTTFVSPLNPIVKKIKSTLANGTVGPKSFNHIYSQNLYNNTQARLIGTSFTKGGFQAKIAMGYFVEYGINLEEGSKAYPVSLIKMLDWAARKGLSKSKGFSVYNKIRSIGSEAYPIIVPLWERERENYKDRVYNKVRRHWR